MKVYDADHTRNIALVGHSGSGKTTIAEAMLFNAGVINRMGTVEEGNTVSDYHKSEQDRQMSIFTSILHTEWQEHKINIFDTPGYLDFTGEVIAALKVVDTAVFVIDGVTGVQVGTEAAWQFAKDFQTPSMFLINALDKEESSFEARIAEIQERFGRGAAVVQVAAGQGTRSIIDVLLMKYITFPVGSREMVVQDIPEKFKERAEKLHNELIESIAENDEGLMELYFEEGTLTEDQMREGLHKSMLKRELFPVFVCSGKHNIGITRFMQFVDKTCPRPSEMPPPPMASGNPIMPESNGVPVAFIFRTMAEEHVGEYSFFRVYHGTIETGMDLENAQTRELERLGQIYSLNGKQRDTVQKIVAGDIGAVVKLRNTHTNNTLRAKGTDYEIQPISFPNPRFVESVVTLKQGEEDKLAQGIHRLHEEDPSLVVIHDADLRQTLLGGQGNMHLDVAKERLLNQFKVAIQFKKPKVGYRETVTVQARAQYRHKKQTGGAGQFADISMLVEPLMGEFIPPADIQPRNVAVIETAWGSKIEFIDAIVGGVIDMRRFFGAIQKGVSERLQTGPLAGYPVGDVRVVIHYGGMHAVDSNENAFKTAAKMCFIQAFNAAKPVLLEPIHEVTVTIPDLFMGDVMGDLNTRRARILGMESVGALQAITALIPQSELYHYSTDLRSITQGRGIHKEQFHSYENMPRNEQEKVIASAEKIKDEE
ncbi:MAG TPA: elongation factor G [Rhodothermales bacterium]|nr:elongation factor G [Rhodothermales bacterium]